MSPKNAFLSNLPEPNSEDQLMINSVHIRNFKNIRSADIDLERLTVFVGANASGKSSVLEAVHYCTLAANGDAAKHFRN